MAAKIIAVDDVAESLAVITAFLTQEGYDLRPTTSGREALRVAAIDPPDLVLLDIRMPEMDGFEVCAALRENAATAATPVIFLSASSDLDDKLKAFRVGGADYIEKPFQEEEVLARVRHQLELRRMRQELEAARNSLEATVAARTQQLALLAYRDLLTRLPNRKRLQEYLDGLLADAAARSFALLLLDLDRFKVINDTLGHWVGDRLLALVAERLVDTMAERRGLVARLGGDEFAICIEDCEQADAERLAQTVIARLDQPFDLEGIRLEVGVSVGIAVYPRDGRGTSELLRCADVAMYIAKRTLAGYSCYSASADVNSPGRLVLVSEFPDALQRGELVLHYQPKIHIADGTVSGLEALIRWHHPRLGLLMPGEFLPLIEVSDLIRRMTYWVIETAVAQVRAWLDEDRRLVVAVNLSSRNLVDEALPDWIAGTLERHGVPPALLEVEITETAMVVDPDRSLAVVDRIAALGVGVAVDDFGTGYSSFALLRRLPRAVTLKIDRSFVQRMPENPADAAVVNSIVQLVRGLEARAIAEGVEDAAVLAMLGRLGCDEAQGYYISRPMSAAATREWLEARAAGTDAAPPTGNVEQEVRA